MHKKRYLTSAPALSVFAVCAIAATLWAEASIRVGQDTISSIQIISDDGEEFDISDTSELPDATKLILNELVGSSEIEKISITQIEGLPEFSAASRQDQLGIKTYVGRILTSKNRFQESFELLNSLTSEELQRNDGTFAYAETLKGLGEETAALQAYRLHISQNPNHQAGHINYAIYLANLDQREEAIPILQRAIEITSGNRKGKSYSLLGIQHLHLANYQDAVDSFERSIKLRPGHGPTWRRLASAQAKLADYSQEDVISTFQKSDAVSPNNAKTKDELASYMFSIGRFDEALPYYREASKLAPENVSMLVRRAQNLIASERPSAARRVLKKIKAQKLTENERRQFKILDTVLNGNQAKVLKLLETGKLLSETDSDKFNLLIAFLDVGDFENASALAAGFDIRSRYSQPARFMIAQSFFKSERHQDALAKLQALVAENAESPAFWYYLGRANAELGNIESALQASERAYSLYPDSGRITIAHSHSLSASGNSSRAVAVLLSYLESKPKDARVLTTLAEFYVDANNYERAEQLFKSVQDLQPDNLRIAKELANAQILGKQSEAAIRTLDVIIAKNPSDIEARLLRADAYMQSGQKNAAIVDYETVLKLDADNRTAKSKLGRIGG